MSAYERLLAAENSRGSTFVDEGWLPPEDECPELGHLRAEHLRLLNIVNESLVQATRLRREAESTETRRAEAVREAILAGKDPAKVNIAAPDEDAIARAYSDHESACEALEMFVQRTLAEIAATAPTIEANIAVRLREAEAKRIEARRLLEESKRLVADPERLLSWLDRYVTVEDTFSGETRKRSALGPIAFSSTDVPLPTPIPDVISEIAGLGPAEVIEVGSDQPLPEEMEAMHAA